MNAVTDRTKIVAPPTLTAVETIIIAAAGFPDEFSEWDLTVAAWRLDPAKFSMRGHPHPDHKRMSMEIMGRKPTSPIERKLMERTRPNHLRVTPLGRAHAARLIDPAGADKAYHSLRPFLNSEAFNAWVANPEEPRTPASLTGFIAIGSIADAREATRIGLAWLRERNVEAITHRFQRNTHRMPSPIHFNTVVALGDFLTAMVRRFAGLAAPKARRA